MTIQKIESKQLKNFLSKRGPYVYYFNNKTKYKNEKVINLIKELSLKYAETKVLEIDFEEYENYRNITNSSMINKVFVYWNGKRQYTRTNPNREILKELFEKCSDFKELNKNTNLCNCEMWNMNNNVNHKNKNEVIESKNKDQSKLQDNKTKYKNNNKNIKNGQVYSYILKFRQILKKKFPDEKLKKYKISKKNFKGPKICKYTNIINSLPKKSSLENEKKHNHLLNYLKSDIEYDKYYFPSNEKCKLNLDILRNDVNKKRNPKRQKKYSELENLLKKPN